MNTKDSTAQHSHWKIQVFERFMQILKAPYGDFQSIWNLANAINDEEGFRQTVEVLSTHPSAKHAIQNRLCLGAIDLQQLHSLPVETLGYAYSDHLIRNSLVPLQSQVVENEYDYLILHLTEFTIFGTLSLMLIPVWLEKPNYKHLWQRNCELRGFHLQC